LFAYRGKQPFPCPRSKLAIKVSPIKHTEGIREIEEKGFILADRINKKATQYRFLKQFFRFTP